MCAYIYLYIKIYIYIFKYIYMMSSSGHQAPPSMGWGGVQAGLYHISNIVSIYIIFIYTARIYIYIYYIYIYLSIYYIFIYIYIYLSIYYMYSIYIYIYTYSIYTISPPSHRGGRGKHLFAWTSQPLWGGPGKAASYIDDVIWFEQSN